MVEDAGGRQKNYTALDHTDCLAVCRRAARLKRKGGKVEGNGRRMVCSASKKRDKNAKANHSLKKDLRTRNHPTHQQPQPTSRKNNQEHQAAAQKHTQHQAKQPRKATTAQHGTPATPPSKKKTKKEEKNPQSNPKICNFGKKSAIAILSLYKDNSQKFFFNCLIALN